MSELIDDHACLLEKLRLAEAEIERLREERDEAREAARWLVSNVNYEDHYEAVGIWPWLEEEARDV